MTAKALKREEMHEVADALVAAYVRCFNAHEGQSETEFADAYKALDKAKAAVNDAAFNTARVLARGDA